MRQISKFYIICILYSMNFEYESTFLVVDPKGFPFRELPLESSGLYAKPTNHLTETEIF